MYGAFAWLLAFSYLPGKFIRKNNLEIFSGATESGAPGCFLCFK
jgi:hypothetical protein